MSKSWITTDCLYIQLENNCIKFSSSKADAVNLIKQKNIKKLFTKVRFRIINVCFFIM